MTPITALLETLRPRLLRYARLQLRNDAWAEDAVSETLLAALERPGALAGKAHPLPYLIGILKHKLVDQLRRHVPEVALGGAGDDDDLDELLFTAEGRWREPPADWGDPESLLDRRQFLEVLELCVERLPPAQGRAFMMREWLELATGEICAELAITPNHLWVLLHRARLRLRDCLQTGWFDGQAATP